MKNSFRVFLLFSALLFTGCFDIVEQFVINADGTAKMRIKAKLDSTFVMMMAYADLEDSAEQHYVAEFADSIKADFVRQGPRIDSLPGMTGYDIDAVVGADSSVTIIVTASLSDYKYLAACHSDFWDDEGKQATNDPTAFPSKVSFTPQKNGDIKFAFVPNKPHKKQGRDESEDPFAKEILKDKSLKFIVSSPVTLKHSKNAELTESGDVVWTFPLIDLVKPGKTVVVGDAVIRLK